MGWRKLEWQNLPIEETAAHNVCVRLRNSLFIVYVFTPHRYFLDTDGNIFATDFGGRINHVNEYLVMDPREGVG